MESFKTTDIILAAVLRINGVEIIDIEIMGTKGTFVFCNVDEDFLVQYDLGKVLVEPVTFNNMVKQLTTSVRRLTRSGQ